MNFVSWCLLQGRYAYNPPLTKAAVWKEGCWCDFMLCGQNGTSPFTDSRGLGEFCIAAKLLSI